jgi:predicted regulator of Ras-like GTPase activity (Roadblock/LC7/MglB family)
MTFREILEEMHGKDPGVTAAALVGSDGLTVEEWRAPGEERDLSALCPEIVRFFLESDRIAGENGLGSSEELRLSGDRAQVFVRRVTPEYLVMIVGAREAVPGKCRFLLGRAARRMRDLL